MGFIDNLLGGIFDGIGWIWDQTAGRAANAIWDQIVGGLVSWVTDAIAFFVRLLLGFFERSSTPDVTAGWFAGKTTPGGAGTPFQVVASLALGLVLLFVLVGILHGLAIGEGPAMAARLGRDVAVAIFGLVAVLGVTQALLGLTDEVSTNILSGTDAGQKGLDALRALGEKANVVASPTFVVFLIGLVVVIAAFFVWVELLIRGAMIFVLVALSPLAFAAFVWPAARGVLKKLAELALALIFSKVVIAIAIAVSAAALSNGSRGGLVPNEAKVGTMLMGAIMFLLSAFAPFVLLKLFPVAEAALVAQGVSRSPMRTAQSAMSSSFYVSRLAGSNGPATPRPLPSGGPDAAGGPGGPGSPGGAAGGGGGSGGTAGGAGVAAAAVGAGVAVAASGVSGVRRRAERMPDASVAPPAAPRGGAGRGPDDLARPGAGAAVASPARRVTRQGPTP